MTLSIATHWHRASFDRLMNELLPDLLAARLPLSGYEVDQSDGDTCRLRVSLSSAGDIELSFDSIPQPDEKGLFHIGGDELVIVPTASDERLDTAEIKCVGEQLYDYIEERLGEAPRDLPWDSSLAVSWLPIEKWIHDFLTEAGQKLDVTNQYARLTHLRRVLVPNRTDPIAPGQFGRTCPFEVPEGPNIGRVFTVALGADIRDGRLVITDDSPHAGLGVTASGVPFLEFNDPNRILMGVNMMRQWMVPPDPEPAMVQTGLEPSMTDLWCGRNLLTAFVSWGEDTFEDGILISETASKRLNYPHPLEAGDKISTRQGLKGVVSCILPDEEMPHTSEGIPVDLVFSYIGLHTRLTVGAVLEAAAGRIARAEGAPFIAPPFGSPGQEELCERLESAGLPADGMDTLTLGRGGKPLSGRSTVGWVYWGKTNHAAAYKIHMAVTTEGPCGPCNRQSDFEYYALRDMDAFENAREYYNTKSVDRPGAREFAQRVAEGAVEQAGPPTPMFAKLARRLAAAGIRAELDGDRLTFRFSPPEDESLKLAVPVPHPWLSETSLSEVGVLPDVPEYEELAKANSRLGRMVSSNAPESLRRKALDDLKSRLDSYLGAVLGPDDMRFRSNILFSGRTVLAPGAGLRIDQLGIPEEMAWVLFGPLVQREVCDSAEVEQKTERASKVLDDVMSRSWIILNRAPTFRPTAILAFRPVRCPGRVIRLHPMVCRAMNADFDGDQAAVFLPITDNAQKEAGEKLSIAGHFARDPGLLDDLLPVHEAMWGLAYLSLTPAGLGEIAEITGTEVAAPNGFVTRETLAASMRYVLRSEGVPETLTRLERLMRRGLEVSRETGASMSPLIGLSLERPAPPEGCDLRAWEKYTEQVSEEILSHGDYGSSDLGVQILAVKSGARGQAGNVIGLNALVGVMGMTPYFDGTFVPIPHAFRDGLTWEEMLARVVGAREAMTHLAFQWQDVGHDLKSKLEPKGFGVLDRAMRSKHPGVVFARAAATREMDPLADVDSRLFVGLPADYRVSEKTAASSS